MGRFLPPVRVEEQIRNRSAGGGRGAAEGIYYDINTRLEMESAESGKPWSRITRLIIVYKCRPADKDLLQAYNWWSASLTRDITTWCG